MPFFRLSQIKLPLDHDEGDIKRRVAKLLRIPADELAGVSIEKKSFDARDRSDIRIVYAVIAELRSEPPGGIPESVAIRAPERGSYVFPGALSRSTEPRPIIVGSGPAGLFCALLLAEQGYRPLVLERGDDVDTRSRRASAFFDSGNLDPETNIQFGEGGAGTYSDGKLNTTVTDAQLRNAKVLEEFVEAGAPPEIRYLSKPHIGTDYLVRVVKGLRKKIEALGGEVRFRSRVDALLVSGGRVSGVEVDGVAIESGVVVLATGHSSRDTFLELQREGIAMERKPFAIGLRIEHPQEMISRRQFGESWRHPALPVADYKLTHRSSAGRGVYTFCMCPGGYVVNSSSEPGMLVCNGMSDFRRDSPNANSAIVATVGPEDFGEGGELSGMEFQRRWERLAFEAGGGDFSLPLQTFGDFLAGRRSAELGGVKPSIRGRYSFADLNACLPDYVAAAIKEAVQAFDRSIPGFARADALLTGVETRTSSPLRILRGENFQASLSGLYPCGEGAGYSGGIMSSAIDGIKVAEAIAQAR